MMITPATVVDVPACIEPLDRTAQAPAVPEPEPKVKDGKPSLTDGERQELECCEKQIDSLRTSEFLAGDSLRIISEKELYREEFNTFEEYCQDKWDMSPQHAYRLINAAKFMSVVETCNQIGDEDRPKCESHIRPLIDGLEDEDKRLEAWQQVIEKADGEKVTGKLVQEVADEMRGKKRRKVKAKVAKPPKAKAKALNSAISEIDKALKKAGKDKQQKGVVRLLTRIRGKIESYLKSLKS